MTCNGIVDVASIPQQIDDQQRGITRDYKDARYFCPKCWGLHDFEILNRVIEGMS